MTDSERITELESENRDLTGVMLRYKETAENCLDAIHKFDVDVENLQARIDALEAENARLWEAAQAKLDSDHADGDFGYLTREGEAECCLCGRSAESREAVEHDDGCSQVAHDRLEAALTTPASTWLAGKLDAARSEGAVEALDEFVDKARRLTATASDCDCSVCDFARKVHACAMAIKAARRMDASEPKAEAAREGGGK